MLNVLLVESGIDSAALETALTGEGTETVKIQYGPSFVALVKETQPDTVILNVDIPSDDILSDLCNLNRQWPVPVILFAADACQIAIAKAIQAEVSALVINGLEPQRIHNIIQIALTRFKHQQTLKTALLEAKTQLEDRKHIDRAKAILMKTQNFTEHEAYHTLRKLAMDRNITLGQMARNVIAMAELLK